MAHARGTFAHRKTVWLVSIVLSAALAQAVVAGGAGIFDVRDYGAAGDGKTLDTVAISKAVEACAAAGGGQVRFPPGRYLSATVRLKSHVTLFLESGAVLVGAPDPNLYQHPTLPAFMPEARWGKWHRALILGDGLEDIALAGAGVIDGNKVFDPTGEERMRGPHTFVFVNCRDVTIRDVSFVDSANYAIFFQISDRVDIHNVKFTGGWDGVHFRGGPGHPCRNVSITDCRFYTGDDSIAGRYWENVVISDCIVNSSCNGIRLIGPATHLIIRDCLFYGPGVHPHRTSDRYNMLAGINLQPGAWDKTTGDLDDVLISDVTMQNVTTPFHLMMKPGNTAGRITVSRVTATGVYRAACSVESWAETPFKNVIFRDVDIEFEGGGTIDRASSQVKAPGVDARALPAWGFYARNVENLTFEDVRLTCTRPDQRPVMICEDVNRLTLNTFKFPRFESVPDLMMLTEVAHVRLQDKAPKIVQPQSHELTWTAKSKTGGLAAGQSYSVTVTVENGAQGGLGKVRLTAAGQTHTSWIWLRPNEKKEILFDRLVAPQAGTYDLQAGNLRRDLVVTPKP